MSNSLYEKIYDMDNLYAASKAAMKGKKRKGYVAKFWLNEDKELQKIHQELKSETYRFGTYKEFVINDNGVTRKISAAPFRDRVVHHAITRIIEPMFDAGFIYDSYANRKGKGTLKALQRARMYAHRYSYVLQLDIKKYFPSIDHELLLIALKKKISCSKTLGLLEKLIAHSNFQEDAFFYYTNDTLFTPYERRKGLPLGNQTSQFFGNIYLNAFDHYVKEALQIKGYIRYVDDMLLFDNSDIVLKKIVSAIVKKLTAFRLKIHPFKIKLLETKKGFVFLGHKVFPTHFRVTSKAIRRGRKKLKKVRFDYFYGKITTELAKNRIFGTIGFFKMGNNYRINEELLSQTVLVKKV
ncbi:MAG: hypothetical protein B5M52_05815 [Helicobacteraceae bacterium 4484_230]|nr:MAG: hypothetical protein B5M52_05815 [Helicobacteraceae bacterium 4484_230]